MKLNEISGGQSVWILYSSEITRDSNVFGIFSTEKLANEALHNTGESDLFEIKKIILNKMYYPKTINK